MVVAAETSMASTILLVVLGAVVGVVPAVTVERFRSKDARHIRTRELTLDRTTEFTRAARKLRARSEAYGSDPTDTNLSSIVTAHEDLWVAFECLVMVATVEVQETAREALARSVAETTRHPVRVAYEDDLGEFSVFVEIAQPLSGVREEFRLGDELNWKWLRERITSA